MQRETLLSFLDRKLFAFGLLALSGCWGLATSGHHASEGSDPTEGTTRTDLPTSPRVLHGLADCQSSYNPAKHL